MFAGPATIHEFPHPPAIVQFHPRKDQPFAVEQMLEALRLGARAVELDLRWRAADSSVVCSHEPRGLSSRPTLDEALDALFRFQGGKETVRGDGLQFFLVLDLKEELAPFHRALVRTLAARSARFSNAGPASRGPRGTTVVLTGFRAALQRSIPASALDTLCVVEGRDYRGRIADHSGQGGPFQWLALDYPVERSRIRDLHAGRDPGVVGRFNVRVVGARGHVRDALRAGADAVNADLDELEAGAATAGQANRAREPARSAP
jgi:hypothetical protein